MSALQSKSGPTALHAADAAATALRQQRRDARRVLTATTGPTFAIACLQFLLPVIAPQLMASMGGVSTAFGIVMAAVTFGCVVLYLVNGAVLPAIGPVALLQLALALSIVGIALLMVGTWPTVMVGAFVIGVGFAALTPASSQLISEFIPKTRWATAFSIRVTAIPLGGIAAGITGTYVAATFGWRSALLLSSLLCGLSAIFVVGMPRSYNRRDPSKRLRFGKLFSLKTARQPFAVVARSAQLKQIIAAGACLAVLHGILTVFLVSYLTSIHGLTLQQAGFLFAIVQGVGILGRFGLGPLADRLGTATPIMIVMGPAGFAAMLMIARFDPTWPLLVQSAVAAFAGLAVSTYTGLYLSEVARRSPPSQIALASSASGLASFSTFTVTPLAFAALATAVGWPSAFTVLGIFGVIVVVLLAYPVDAAPANASTDATAVATHARMQPLAEPASSRTDQFQPEAKPAAAITKPVVNDGSRGLRGRLQEHTPRLLQGKRLRKHSETTNPMAQAAAPSPPPITEPIRVIRFTKLPIAAE